MVFLYLFCVMSPFRASKSSHRGFTLLEMTIVIMMLMALISMGMFTSRKLDDWRLGRAASETLRTVYAAQRMYLADHPTAKLVTLTHADILPYMGHNGSGTLTVMPTVKSLTGAELVINVTTSPPTIDAGSGTIYDPSGNLKDSLWDTGM